jgi:hypothetical protein
VVINSAATLAELGEQAAPDRWGPGVLARLGAALARRQQYGSARIELERSCAALASSAAAHELGDGEFSQLQLVEVLIAMGRFCEARTFADRLLPPGHHLASRTGASRGLAAVHLAGGAPPASVGTSDSPSSTLTVPWLWRPPGASERP